MPQSPQQHGQQNGTHAAASTEESSPHTPHPGAKPRPVAPQPKSAPPWDRRRRPNGISNGEGGGGGGATYGSLNVEGGAGSERDALIPSGGGGRLSRSSSREGLAARSPAARVVLKRSASGRRLAAGSEPRSSSGSGGGSGWDPTIWGSALIAVAGLALAVAWFVASAVMQAPAPPSCISYRPAAVRASDQNEKLHDDATQSFLRYVSDLSRRCRRSCRCAPAVTRLCMQSSLQLRRGHLCPWQPDSCLRGRWSEWGLLTVPRISCAASLLRECLKCVSSAHPAVPAADGRLGTAPAAAVPPGGVRL